MYQRCLREKGDKEFEEEIGGDEQKLEHERGAPEGIDARRAAGQFDEADGRGGELVQGQPQVFRMAFLREVERQEKDGEHHEEDGVDQLGQALEEHAIGPEIELALNIDGVTEVKRARGEEAGVGVIAECGVDDAHDQGEGGLGGIEIQVVDARDGLKFLGRVAVRTFRLDLLAVGEDFRAEAGRADFEGGAVRDGQFDEKR